MYVCAYMILERSGRRVYIVIYHNDKRQYVEHTWHTYVYMHIAEAYARAVRIRSGKYIRQRISARKNSIHLNVV